MSEPLAPEPAAAASVAAIRTEDRVTGRARLNPFVRTSEGFFAGGDRGRQLEELRHLSRWSRRLLAVTGERGVGKSSLYRAVSGSLDPGVKAARINANLTSDTREVLTGLLQGFGIAAPGRANPALLAQLITVHVEEQAEARRHCLVLVDDAHLLELPALEQLLRLVDATSDDALRIVFFAEAYFIQALDKASKRMSNVRAWHEIRLVPLGPDDTRRYLEFRLQEVGVEGRSPFSGAEIDLIVRQSQGYPGRINEAAAGILEGEISVIEQRRWLPRGHRAVVLLLLALMATVWLAWASYQRHADVIDAPIARSEARSPRDVETLTLPGDVEPVEPERPRSITAVDPKTDRGGATTAAPGARTATTGSERDAVGGVAAAAPSVPPETPKALGAESPPPPQKSVAEPVRPSATTTAEAPAPRPAPAPRAAESTVRKGSAWILDQPASHFTLQLLATASRESWQSYLALHGAESRLAGFEMRRDGAVWYAVVFGSYATKAEAEAAARRLPDSLGGVEPWVRTFGSIQGIMIR